MCIAVPGKLIQVDGHRGLVDIRGNRLSVELGLVQAIPGDFLLIHAGCAIAVISHNEAEELESLLSMVDIDGQNN